MADVSDRDTDILISHADRMWCAEVENAERYAKRVRILIPVATTLAGLILAGGLRAAAELSARVPWWVLLNWLILLVTSAVLLLHRIVGRSLHAAKRISRNGRGGRNDCRQSATPRDHRKLLASIERIGHRNRSRGVECLVVSSFCSHANRRSQSADAECRRATEDPDERAVRGGRDSGSDCHACCVWYNVDGVFGK